MKAPTFLEIFASALGDIFHKIYRLDKINNMKDPTLSCKIVKNIRCCFAKTAAGAFVKTQTLYERLRRHFSPSMRYSWKEPIKQGSL